MNEKVRSRVQAAEMGFLRKINGLTLLDKVKSADIRESLNIESLLLRLERSQLRWYGHKLLCSKPIGRRPRGRPKTPWRDYVEDLSWSRLGIPEEHLSLLRRIEMLKGSNSSCCPLDPPRISGSRKLIDSVSISPCQNSILQVWVCKSVIKINQGFLVNIVSNFTQYSSCTSKLFYDIFNMHMPF